MQDRLQALLLTVAMGALAGLVAAMRVDYLAFAAYVRLYHEWSVLPPAGRPDMPKPDFDFGVAWRRWLNGAAMGAVAGLVGALGLDGLPSSMVGS